MDFLNSMNFFAIFFCMQKTRYVWAVFIIIREYVSPTLRQVLATATIVIKLTERGGSYKIQFD